MHGLLVELQAQLRVQEALRAAEQRRLLACATQGAPPRGPTPMAMNAVANLGHFLVGLGSWLRAAGATPADTDVAQLPARSRARCPEGARALAA
jgi:hypothetical protein